jgi:hypothetical protein
LFVCRKLQFKISPVGVSYGFLLIMTIHPKTSDRASAPSNGQTAPQKSARARAIT